MKVEKQSLQIDAGAQAMVVKPLHAVNKGRICVVVKRIIMTRNDPLVWWLCAFEKPVKTDTGIGRLAAISQPALFCLARDSFTDEEVREWGKIQATHLGLA